MASSKYYKLWLRNSPGHIGDAGTGWLEVPQFTGMQFSNFLNYIPEMSCTVYTKDTTLQAQMKAGVIWRITTVDANGAHSTNGTVLTNRYGQSSGEGGTGREVLTGILDAPTADEKTAIPQNGNTPIVYNLVGSGYLGQLSRFLYNDTQTLSGTAAQIIAGPLMIDSVDKSLAAVIGTSNVVMGDIDTGPTISIRISRDELAGVMHDIARIGSPTTLYMFYLDADPNNPATNDFKPKVHYRSPFNAVYSTGGGGVNMTVDEGPETRSADTIEERDRVINSVVIVYSGIGSGTGKIALADVTEGSIGGINSSRTRYGVRNVTIYAPWISNEYTAERFRNTIADMYKGGISTAIMRFEAVMKQGGLFQGDFRGKPGDVVGAKNKAGVTTEYKFHGYEYNQDAGEALRVVFGVPSAPLEDQVTNISRRTRQQFNAMNTTVPRGADQYSLNQIYTTTQQFINVASGAISTYTEALSSNDFGQSEAYQTQVEIDLTNIYGDSPNNDGPLRVLVEFTIGATGYTIFEHTFGPFIANSTGDQTDVHVAEQVYAFSPVVGGTNVTQVKVKLWNHNSYRSVSAFVTVSTRRKPLHAHDL
jgi:hypothetical protein